MGQVVMKADLTGGADELFDDKMYRLAESRDFTKALLDHLINLPTVTKPVKLFVKQRAKTAVAGEVKFTQDMSREIPVKE